MIRSLSFFVKYFLFWILFFFINRLLFEIWYAPSFFYSSIEESLKTFYYGLHMDASMAGYFCVIPFLIYISTWLFPKIKFPNRFLTVYTYILVSLTSFFTLVDVNIYREWGTKFNNRAVEFFLNSTSDAIASSASSPIVASFTCIGLLIFIGVFIYRRLLKTPSQNINNKLNIPLKIISSTLILGFTFLVIRGGWGVAPMNTSKVYFSKTHEYNLASINTDWFLMSSILDNQNNDKSLYQYFPEERVKAIKDSLFKASAATDTVSILKTKNPNVVIIIMESFTADLVKELGGESGVTPKFSELIKEGYLFKHIYSASDRTDKGIVAVLSAFPSQAVRSIIKDNEKQIKLPSLMQEFSKQGYHSSFVYGGDLDFSNFRSYILSHHTQKIIDGSNFNVKGEKSDWGYPDDITFKQSIETLNTQKQPFFHSVLTLSNHEPFDIHAPYKFGNNSTANKFRSTSYFTDEALYQYFEDAKKQDWYQNTLFIIVADHGHREPLEVHNIEDPKRYHIPLLFLGGALKDEYRGKSNDKIGCQVDIASTLLNQLQLPDTAFHYSKDLLNPTVKGFAFYSWDNGFGYIDAQKAISFDPVGNYVLYQQPDSLKDKEKTNALQNAKALMQSVYNNYLKL